MADAAQHFEEGNRLLAARDYAGAGACFRRAIASAPRLAEAHANLAWALEQERRDTEAEASYHDALALRPECVELMINHGAFLARLQRLDEAQAQYLRALAIDARSAPAWSNLAALHAQAGRFEEAEICCRRGLSIDGGHAKAHVNLAYLCLRQGRFEEGWQHHRWRSLPYAGQVLGPGPRWCGETLAGRSLLMGPEGGYGDMIQFCRYAPLLKARGARRVVLVCQPELCSLLAAADGIDEVLGFDAPLPACDFWVPLLSLPDLCGTRLDTIPATIPYLATPAPVSPARAPGPAGPALRVGLAWLGNPHHANDRERSIHAAEVLEPLGEVQAVQWVELQRGADAPHWGALRRRLRMEPARAADRDFVRTAALIDGLDLVISVDSAVAHLAGALGKPCWVLLPWQMTDWRWLTDRSDSPWYPGVMRLFRQPARGAWAPVVDAVIAALRRLQAQRG
jgi:tetratricopeptide (TPR) repeat protein